MHVIAAKAVAFGEAQHPSFKKYVSRVIANATALSNGLKLRGINIVSDGTDTHLVLVDLRNLCITGLTAETALESVGITCNKNGIPFDPEKPAITSGIRLGTPAATTRGFGVREFETVANLIADVLHEHSQQNALSGKLKKRVCNEVDSLCQQFPIY